MPASGDMIDLIEPCIPGLRRYARSLLRDPTEADDLVQDCLERAIGRWGQRREDGTVRTWLFAILHNLAMSRLRRAAGRAAAVPLEDAAAAALAVPPAQEDRMRHADLLAGLARLPEEQRAVLLLVSVEGLAYAEAAAVLAAPIGTVMSRLSRARDNLARFLDGPGETVRRPILRRVK